MPIITIDGNIGCGKSSVLNHLHRNYKIAIDLEPVDSWNAYLSKIYDDKQDVFKFQIRVWLDRCWIQEKSDKTLILMERSPYFIQNTFIDVAYKSGLITETENEILLNLYKKTDNLWTSNTYIYLRSNPENSYKRIKKRNRQSEKNISLDYIKSLHESHEIAFEKAVEQKMNIIVIDVDDKSIAEVASEILQFITMK